MFGKVTKGIFGSEQGSDNLGAQVEALLARAADGVLVQDRAEAFASLSELLQSNEQAQKIIGMNGLPVLIGVLRDDRGEKQLLRGALECLNVALSLSPDGDRQSASAMNAELFARGEGNMELLLALLDSEDFYVRCHAVQLLTALAAGGARAHRLSQVVMAAADGVSKLLKLLADKHEAVRNEALLLLAGLSHSHPGIRQKASAGGAFGQVLSIIRQEGGIDGGIVVQDCLDLLNNLLRSEPHSQQSFREAGHLQKLLDYLKQPEGNFLQRLPRQKAANLLALLETFTLLLAQPPGGAQVADAQEAQHRQNQALLLKLGLLDKLLMLALKGDETSAQPIRTQGLLCLAHLISGFPAGRERLVMSGLGWLRGTPALRQVLRVCLSSRNAGEHAAAESVIRAFCLGNSDGQAMLAATLVPVADADPGNTTFGGELVKALKQPGSAVSSRAAAVLTCMLEGNAATKQRLLTIPLELSPAPGSPPQPLMLHCISHLSEAVLSPGKEEQKAAGVFLRLLVSWLVDCPPAVKAFAENPAHLPLLVDIVNGRKGRCSAAVIGLAALLLGVCLVTEEAEAEAVVLDFITTSVGLAPFFGALDGLLADEGFKAAAEGPTVTRPAMRVALPAPVTEEEEEPPAAGQNGTAGVTAVGGAFDPAFARWAQAFCPLVRQRVIGGGGETPRQPRFEQLGALNPDQQLQQALAAIQSLEREVESLKARNRALTQQAIDLGPSGANGRPAMDSNAASPAAAAALAAAESKAQQAERRASAAEDRARSLQQELESLRGDLRTAGEKQTELEARLQEATRDAEEAAAAASKYEADLEALSSAYTGLEAHAHQLEAKLGTSVPAAAETEPGGEEGGQELDDLLACLGEEELKVEVLSEKLRELGQDPEALLADVGGASDVDEQEAPDFT